MAWYTKLGRGVTALVGGVAQELPGTLERRFQGQQLNRQEQRYRKGLTREDEKDAEQRIRNRAAAGDWEGAISQAKLEKQPALEAELRGMQTGTERLASQAASRKQLGIVAGAREATMNRSPLDPSTADALRQSAEKVSTGLAETQSLPGVETSERQQATRESQAFLSSLHPSIQALNEYSSITASLSPHDDPEVSAQKLDQLEQVLQKYSFGGDPKSTRKNIEEGLTTLKRELYREAVNISTDPTVLDSLPLFYKITNPDDAKLSALKAASIRYEHRGDMTQEQLNSVQTAWRMYEAGSQIGSEASMQQAADFIRPNNPAAAAFMESSAKDVIKRYGQKTKEERLQDLLHTQLQDPDLLWSQMEADGFATRPGKGKFEFIPPPSTSEVNEYWKRREAILSPGSMSEVAEAPSEKEYQTALVSMGQAWAAGKEVDVRNFLSTQDDSVRARYVKDLGKAGIMIDSAFSSVPFLPTNNTQLSVPTRTPMLTR